MRQIVNVNGGKINNFISVRQVLGKFDNKKDKYISREWQGYAVKLAEELNDKNHIGLYMKLSRDLSRSVLERAREFVKDANARSKVKLFMWKIGQLKIEKNKNGHAVDKQSIV